MFGDVFKWIGNAIKDFVRGVGSFIKNLTTSVGKLFVVVVALIGSVIVGVNLYTATQGQKTNLAYLEKYFNASSKHGTFIFSAKYADGNQKPDEEAEFWVKDKNIRIDILGNNKREIVTKNNTPYLCGRPPFGDNGCSPAVIPVETYLLGFTKTSGTVRNLGFDTPRSCNKYQYEVKNTFSQTNAPNTYYVEDITYCIRGEKLIYTTYRGYIPEKDGQILDPEKMDVSTYKFKTVEIGVNIPDSLFSLPYPVLQSAY